MDFVLVGALSAVLQGAGVTTFDVDVVHSRDDANLERFLTALRSMNAVYRGHPARLSPTKEHLETAGHQLLLTDYGPLDVLGTIEDGMGYDELQTRCVVKNWQGQELHVLSLSEYVALKEKSTTPKDQARLPLLREAAKMEEE